MIEFLQDLPLLLLITLGIVTTLATAWRKRK